MITRTAFEEKKSIDAAAALRRARAWAISSAFEMQDASVLRHDDSARIERAVACAVAEGVDAGAIPVTSPRRRGRRAFTTRPASVETFARVRFARGAFHSWLACAPIETLLGVALTTPVATALEVHRHDVHPREAVTHLARGEPWSEDQWHAHIARASIIRGVLLDHEKCVGRLTSGAVARLQVMAQEDADLDVALERARDRIQKAIADGALAAYCARSGRQLGPGDFAAAIQLDPLHGVFVVSHDVDLFGTEWELARAACDRIGQVRLAAAGVLAMTPKQRVRTTSAALGRAKKAFRALCARWLSGAAPIPKRTDWIKAACAQFTVTAHAATVIWTEVISEDEAYAPLRRPGKRPKIANQ